MRWVGEHLIEYAEKEETKKLRQYSMQEIDDMLDEAEAAFEAGEFLTNDEVFHHRQQTYRSIIVRKLNKIVYYVKGDTLHIAAFWDTRREPKRQARRAR